MEARDKAAAAAQDSNILEIIVVMLIKNYYTNLPSTHREAQKKRDLGLQCGRSSLYTQYTVGALYLPCRMWTRSGLAWRSPGDSQENPMLTGK